MASCDAARAEGSAVIAGVRRILPGASVEFASVLATAEAAEAALAEAVIGVCEIEGVSRERNDCGAGGEAVDEIELGCTGSAFLTCIAVADGVGLGRGVGVGVGLKESVMGSALRTSGSGERD